MLTLSKININLFGNQIIMRAVYKKLLFTALIFLTIVSNSTLAESSNFSKFKISSIRFEGLKKVPADALFATISIKKGDELNPENADEIINELYNTGFFNSVELYEGNNNQLVVVVKEKPVLGNIKIEGTKSTDKIKSILKDNQIITGQMFNKSKVNKAVREIQAHFISQGYYSVRVNFDSKFDGDSRVDLTIGVYQGVAAKIKSITFTGNNSFSDSDLKAILLNKTTNILSYFTSDDQYLKEKVQADQESIKNFYMNNGFLKVNVANPQVTLSQDKKEIFINFPIDEGDKYYFGSSRISGNYRLSNNDVDLQKIIDDNIKCGAVFSRQVVIDTRERIKQVFGNDGYINAEINPETDENDETKTVSLNFSVSEGNRVYVRRIILTGNHNTEDRVLRTQIMQQEKTWASSTQIEDSKENLIRQQFVDKVDVKTTPVNGSQDEVDVTYELQERNAGKIYAGAGYSTQQKFQFNLGIEHANFLGSGKDVSLTLENTTATQSYAFSYFDPYYTSYNFGVGGSLFYNKANLAKVSDVSNYSQENLGGAISLGYITSRYDRIGYTFGAERKKLRKYDNRPYPTQIQSFVDQFGETIDEYPLGVSINHNDLNHYLFPTKGLQYSIGAQAIAPFSSVQYYLLTFKSRYYYPIAKGYTAAFYSQFGYGAGYNKTSTLPFYRNFVLGGQSLRGFEEGSVGPIDSEGRGYGGNIMGTLTFEIIFPPPFAANSDTIRTSVFFDAGQTYLTKKPTNPGGGVTISNPKGIRASVGISLTWMSPFGTPIVISLAQPVIKKPGDKLQAFLFSFGANF